jgi:hypothetical protein
MAEANVQHYLARGDDFIEGMKELRRKEDYPYSSALLAIHAAVSYCDALRIGLGDRELADDDHGTAARKLRLLLVERRRNLDDSGIKHLEMLTGKKSLVAYGKGRISDTDFENIFTKAERFAAWALRTGKDLDLGGWRNVNG